MPYRDTIGPERGICRASEEEGGAGSEGEGERGREREGERERKRERKRETLVDVV